MAWYHVGGCDCPIGCCDCGVEYVYYNPIKNEFTTAISPNRPSMEWVFIGQL